MEAMRANDVKNMMIAVAERMIECVDALGEADRMGDGDHGTGMGRGFREVKDRLEATQEWSSISEVLDTVGKALMMKVGGAAGAIFGTMFRGGGKAVSELEELGAAGFARFLESGLQAMRERGKASPGDKTAVDALEPAATAARSAIKSGLPDVASSAAAAAAEGAESTKNMVATVGKAKTLGERTIGHVDPGALSVSIMLAAMRDYIKQNGG
jgi:dihydroxyacetone kinase-like protein